MVEAERLSITYHIPSDHPDPADVRSRLDRVAADRLGRVLSDLLSRAMPPNDTTIWMVHSLDVNLDLDPEAGPEALTEDWAASIVRALAHRYEHPPADSGDYRFSDEADLLSRYLTDVAADHSDKWCYARFEGLQVLPASAKIRTALCDNPSTGLAALRRLATDARRRVLHTMSEHDARRVFATFGSTLPELPLARLWSWWDVEGRLVPDSEGEARWALLMAVGAGADMEWPHAAPALARFLRLAPEHGDALLEALASHQVLQLFRIVPATDADALSPLLGTPRVILEPWVAPVEPTPEREHEPPRVLTPFGGVFLLLPYLTELPVSDDIGPAVLFRLWVLLKCLGPRAFNAFLDSALRDLLQIDAGLSVRDFAAWQKSVPVEALETALRLALASDIVRPNAARLTLASHRYLRLPDAFHCDRRRDDLVSPIAHLVIRALAWRLPGFANSSLQHLSENVLDLSARIQDWPDRRVIRLSPPPLQLVLNLTGLSRQQYLCPWLDTRRFELYPEGP